MSLKVTTARNSLIMGGVQFAMRPINFLISVILARLLDPTDFGLVTLTLVLVQSSNLFSGLGMGQAIIHSQEERGKIAYHAFVMVMTMALLLFSLVQIFCEPLSLLLGDVRTAPLLRWLSGWILLSALSLVPHSLLRKDLRFEKAAFASLISELVYAVVVIGLAYLGYGVWSLVYANLIFTGVTTSLYWAWCPGWEWVKPQPWDSGVMKRLLRYGVPVSGSGFLSYFHTHVDDWLVGRILGVAQLGFYSKAYDFSHTTIGKLARSTIGMVFFPSYSKMQDDRTRLTRAYLKTVRLVFLLITPIAMGIFIIAGPLVGVVFGDKWLPMVTVLQIFALLILTRPISENTSPLFQALGVPGYNMRAALVLLVVMFPALFFLIPRGIEGAAIAVSLSHFVGAMYNIYQVNSLMPGSAKRTVQLAGPILAVGGAMMLTVHLSMTPVANFFGTLASVPAVLTLVGIGVVVYTTLLLFTQGDLLTEIWQTLLAILPKKFIKRRTVRLKEGDI